MSYTIIVEGAAHHALQRIADILVVSLEDAISRALGAELYLLEQVHNHGARLLLDSQNGQLEIDLFVAEDA